MKNFRSALNDAKEALKFDPNNEKATNRIAHCYFELKQFNECLGACKKHFNKENNNKLVDLAKKAEVELKKLQRDKRKEEANKKKILQIQEQIMNAVKQRGIKFRGSIFESIHPAADGHHVHLNENGNLIWPVIFLYPEYGQTDFIESFNENDTFKQHLIAMFGNEPPGWDVNHKYKVGNISVGYQSQFTGEMVKIDSNRTLKEILTLQQLIVESGIPTFILAIGENLVNIYN